MKKINTELMHCDKIYHVYNRGNNGAPIFKTQNNYSFFLKKYALYIEPVASTFAYCLLGNHFHLLVKIKCETEIISNSQIKYPNKVIESIPHYISKQFAHLFNSYSQAFNTQFNRTGNLFETPFRRIEVKETAYFLKLIWYIHFNPQKHGFVKDFREYPYSSYHSHLLQTITKLKRSEVLNWFGGVDEYVRFHSLQLETASISDFIIEID
ncbi:MAG: hypothetical protein EAZ15_06720 [Sphingobacteriales bacterium]|nr:MAG: hypothetical protein EAZ15_06720 [Sphingobacteriales bacterium]